MSIDVVEVRSEERFSRNAETDLVCRLLLEKKKMSSTGCAASGCFSGRRRRISFQATSMTTIDKPTPRPIPHLLMLFFFFMIRPPPRSTLFPYTTLFRSRNNIMVTLHEVITFLVSMQISISSLQTHNVNRCGRSRHLARKLSLRRKRSSPNVFEMAATETITSIILIKLIRVSLGTVRHPRRFKIVVIDIQITLKQMLRVFIGIRVNRAKKSGMVNRTSSVNSRERSGINTILHELNPLFTINVTMRDIKSKNVYSRVNSKATTQWRKTESANGVHLEGVASDNRSSRNGNKTTNLTSKEAKMGKDMRHTLGASLNIRHNLSSSKGPKPLQLKLLTTYIPKTSAFTLACSTSQRLRTTRASARTFFTFRHYITPSARNF